MKIKLNKHYYNPQDLWNIKILNLRIYELERNEIKPILFFKNYSVKLQQKTHMVACPFITSTQEAEPGRVTGFLYSLRVRHPDPK